MEGRRQDELFEAAPGLTRIAAVAAWRTTEWAVGTTAKAGDRLVRAIYGESPIDLLAETGGDLRGQARRLLGLVGLDGDRVADAATADAEAAGDPEGQEAPSPNEL